MRRLGKISVFIAAALLALGLIIKADVAVKGASDALGLCSRVLIPSLFPFMVLSSFAANLPMGAAARRILTPVMRLLFNQNAAAAPVVLVSLIGGYPVGARMVHRLLERKEITADQAGRLLLFCVNAGPAFVVGTVGGVMLSSARAGAVLYASLVVSSLAVGVLSRFAGNDDCGEKLGGGERYSFSQSLVASVADASAGILSVCAWVILFGTVCALLADIFAGVRSLPAVFCLLEVTGGCAMLAGKVSLPVVAAILGFGGLCVHCQVLSCAKGSGINTAVFFTSRVICAVFAAFICSALVCAFPDAVESAAYAGKTVMQAWSVSAPAAAALMFLCALVILDLDTGEKVC